MNNRDPFVYKTTDYGRTWKSVVGDLPKSVFSYAHCVREDPVRRGLLYLGVENGLYFSLDDGDHWTALQSGLPHAPLHWITIQEQYSDLVVATYGRRFYILDDITPLRQMTPEMPNANAHLFAPRAAYRLRNITEPMMMPDDAAEGVNPPDGAAITFWLKTAPPAPPKDQKDAKAAIQIVIKDGAGQTRAHHRRQGGESGAESRLVGPSRRTVDRSETADTAGERRRLQDESRRHAEVRDGRREPAGRARPPGTYSVALQSLAGSASAGAISCRNASSSSGSQHRRQRGGHPGADEDDSGRAREHEQDGGSHQPRRSGTARRLASSKPSSATMPRRRN